MVVEGGCVVVVDVVGGGSVVVVVDVTAGGGVVEFGGAVVGVAPGVVSVPGVSTAVIDVGDSISSGSRVTTRDADVVVGSGSGLARATVVGISTTGWMTRLRTWATAPHENTIAMVAATAQPAISFVDFGMT